MKKYRKITVGFVVQDYIVLPDGKAICQTQNFIAGDQVDYEDKNGDPVDVNIEKEVYCPMDMAQPKQIATGGVKFKCPECGGAKLECCEDGPYVSDVLNIDEEGDFDYGEISASGWVDRFQCSGCGFVLSEKNGMREYPITEVEEVVEWCKKNCKQE